MLTHTHTKKPRDIWPVNYYEMNHFSFCCYTLKMSARANRYTESIESFKYQLNSTPLPVCMCVCVRTLNVLYLNAVTSIEKSTNQQQQQPQWYSQGRTQT